MSNKNSHKPIPKKTDYMKVRGRGSGKIGQPTNKCTECRFCCVVKGVRICHGGKGPSFIPLNVSGCLAGEKGLTYAKFKI